MNKERLLKLAAHLESGQLGHAVFDFSKIKGCAMGELPVLWPDDWVFNRNGIPILRTKQDGDKSIIDGVEEWFDITNDERRSLFYPANFSENHKTKEEVAAKIRKFAGSENESK